MAAGFLRHFAGDRVHVLSAGSNPVSGVNGIAVQVMHEVGIDISRNTPQLIETDMVVESDAVVTMGCGDACPIYPGKRYEDWNLRDPAGQPIEVVREIRDEIRVRVENLIKELQKA
jgi:arsenate reductase